MVVYLIEDGAGNLYVTDFEYIDPYYHAADGLFREDAADWPIWREGCPEVTDYQPGDCWWLEWTEADDADEEGEAYSLTYQDADIVATYDTDTHELQVIGHPGAAARKALGMDPEEHYA